MDKPQDIKYYKTADGKSPVLEWLDSLDRGPRAVVLSYLGRVREGNYSNCENTGGGLSEIKINMGSGYRVYYGWVRGYVILLLCGGTKRHQSNTIAKARDYLADHKTRTISE